MPLEIPPPSDRDALEHARRWLEHVEVGRIGRGAVTTPAIALQHLRNEEVVLGRSRTFSFPTPEPYRGRR